MLNIEIKQGDITNVEADAIVNPANTLGWMGGGAAKAIRDAGGRIVEEEAVNNGPMEIGRALATTAGKLPFKAVIHAPTMLTPAEQAIGYNVGMAIRGALHLADDRKYKVIAIPGLGTGVGGFPHKEAAELMIKELKTFQPINLETVILIDLDENLIKAWEAELNKKK